MSNRGRPSPFGDDPSQGEIMAHFMRLADGRRAMGIRTLDGMSLYTAYHCGEIDEWGDQLQHCSFCNSHGDHGDDECRFALHGMAFIKAHMAQFEAFVQKQEAAARKARREAAEAAARARSFDNFENWSIGEQLAHFRGNSKMLNDYHAGRVDKFGRVIDEQEAFFARAHAVCQCNARDARTGLALTNHAKYCPVYEFLPTCTNCGQLHFAEFCNTCTSCRRQGSHEEDCPTLSRGRRNRRR
jgi:hypothetical protein